MYIEIGTPKAFWFKIVKTNYLVNKTLAKADLGKFLKEFFINFKPILQHLHIFGCEAFIGTHLQGTT
jgi:hypothetical protein